MVVGVALGCIMAVGADTMEDGDTTTIITTMA